MSCHHPAYKSSARRVGTSMAETHQAYPVTNVSMISWPAVRNLAMPHRQRDAREPEIARRELPSGTQRAMSGSDTVNISALAASI